MSDEKTSQVVTRILQAEDRAASSAEELLKLIYPGLRAAAQRVMAHERAGHTLQPTALVHEAFLKLVSDRELPWQNRRHFFSAAADAMRQILIDHARTRNRVKRGGGRRRVQLESLADLAEAETGEIEQFDRIYQRLLDEHPDLAEVVRLRFYAGLSVADTAKALGASTSTVDRRWSLARAWLYRELELSTPT